MTRHLQNVKFKDLDSNVKKRMVKERQVVILYTDKLPKNTQNEILNDIHINYGMTVFKDLDKVDKIDKLKDKISENISQIEKGLVFENYPRNLK